MGRVSEPRDGAAGVLGGQAGHDVDLGCDGDHRAGRRGLDELDDAVSGTDFVADLELDPENVVLLRHMRVPARMPATTAVPVVVRVAVLMAATSWIRSELQVREAYFRAGDVA